jgi:hypothetical protein
MIAQRVRFVAGMNRSWSRLPFFGIRAGVGRPVATTFSAGSGALETAKKPLLCGCVVLTSLSLILKRTFHLIYSFIIHYSEGSIALRC